MFKYFKKTLIAILLVVPIFLNAQSANDLELHNRYWNYRENLRKYFINIGFKSGQSMVATEIEPRFQAQTIKVDTNNADIENSQLFVLGKLSMGDDALSYMGDYMGILATEYWLLWDKGMGNSEEMKAVKNELYFAIYAIERLDKYSQTYFKPEILTDPTIDGFLSRSDAWPELIDYLKEYTYPRIHFLTSNTSQGHQLFSAAPNDYKNNKFVSEIPPDWNRTNTQRIRFNRFVQFDKFNAVSKGDPIYDRFAYYKDPLAQNQSDLGRRDNEMSQDQLIGVLFGFKCIMKFVNSFETVDPDGSGTLVEKNIHNWVKSLTHAIMNRLSAKTYDVYFYTDEELYDKEGKRLNITNFQFASEANYVITNPHFGNNTVKRGALSCAFGYPLEKLGEEITGDNYPGVSVRLKPSVLMQPSRFGQTENVNIKLLDRLIGLTGIIGTLAVTGESGIEAFSSVKLGRHFHPEEENWWRDFYNYLPKDNKIRTKLKNSTGSAMFYIYLPAAAGVWEHNEYYDMMQTFNRIEGDLFWSALKGERPFVSANHMETALLASNCEAIQNANVEDTHNPFNKPSHFAKISSDGNERNDDDWPTYNYNQTSADSIFNPQYYNGMDWMLLYNLYRISGIQHPDWKTISPDLPYQNSYCPCISSPSFYADREIPVVRGTIIEKPVHMHNVHISGQPYTPGNPLKELGKLNMFNKDYEGYGIHLADYLTHNFTLNSAIGGQPAGQLIPEGNLTICGNSYFSIETGALLSTAADPLKHTTRNPGQTIKVMNGSILAIFNNGTLTIEDNTQVIIEEGAFLRFYKGAIINLKGPNSQLIIRGTVELQDNATFQININPIAFHGQIVIDKWWGYASQGPAFTSTDGKGKLNFEGKYKGDFLLKIIGNNGLVIFPTIETVVFKNCRVNVDNKDACIFCQPKFGVIFNGVIVENSWGDPAKKYKSIQIAGSWNSIYDTDIKFAQIGIDFNYLNSNVTYPERLLLNKVNFLKCDMALRVNGSVSYDGGTITDYGEAAIEIIGDVYSSYISNVTIEKSSSNTMLSKAIKYQGHFCGLRHNSFLTDPDIYKVELWGAGSSLWCNTFNHSKNSHIYNAGDRMNLYGNEFQFHAGGNTTPEISIIEKGSISMADGYNLFRDVSFHGLINGTLGNKQSFLSQLNPRPSPPPAPYIDHIDATNNLLYVRHMTSTSTVTNYNISNSINQPIYLKTTDELNTYLQGSAPISSFMTIRENYCNTKKETPKFIKITNDFPEGWDVAVRGSVPPGNMTNNGHCFPCEIAIFDSLFHEKFKGTIISVDDKNETLKLPSGNNIITTATMGSTTLASFYDSMVQQVYGNPYTDFAFWITNMKSVLMNVSLEIDSSTVPYRDELLRDLTYAVGRGIESGQFIVSFRDSVTLNTSIQSVADMYDSAWQLAKANHSYWSMRKSELLENWAKTYRQGEKLALAIDVLNIGLDSLTDSYSQKNFTMWKCLNNAEIVYLRDSISIDSFYKLLTCMPAVAEVPIDSIPIQYDTLSFCHWDSAVLMKPDGAKYNAGSRPHYILNLGDSSILDNLNNNLYYIKEGNYKLIYTPTLLTEYSVKQLTIYKNNFQSDTIDSTYSICSLSSLDTVKYFIPLYLPFTIENTEDTSALYLDSNFVFHLPVGEYTIRVFDSSNCHMTVTNLSVIINLPDTLTVDSTIFAYSWTATEFTTQTTALYFPSLHSMPYTIQDLSDSSMLPDSSDYIYLHEGNYLIKSLDSSNCQVVFTNLTVAVDTPRIEIQDTTVYFCQWDDSSTYEYDTLFQYIPVTIKRTAPTLDTMFTSFLTEGNYVIKYFDTTEGFIYVTNLTVSPNDIETDTVSRSMSYCDWTAFGFDTIGIYNLGYVRYTDSLPHSIEIVTSSLDSISNDSLLEGEYIVSSYDYNNCRKIITNLTVTTDTSLIVTNDSTISYCNFEGSGFDAHNYASYYTPYITPRVTVKRTSPSVAAITNNQLTVGEYTITVYAVYECSRFVTHLTVTATTPDVDYLDTSLSYCDVSEWSHAPYLPLDSLPYTFIMTSPVADSSLTERLTAGSYVLRHYDTINCRIIETSLTVSAMAYDTIYTTDTLLYSCSNDSAVMYGRSCAIGLIKDKFETTIAPIDDIYTLNPHYGFYNSYCIDTVNCTVQKLRLTFYDQIEVPYETTDYAEGTFDRSSGDSCCFVNIDHLSCSGKELAENDEIEIFAMDESMNTTFLLKSTIHFYGETHVLGFKFCPPQWDVSEEHINDWYTIVMKKDTCDFCRFDFMCDSTVEFSAPFQNNSEKNEDNGNPPSSENSLLKSGPSISKVDNNHGGVARIIIYPNPTSNEVNLRINNILNNNIRINIYDNAGRLVFINDYSVNKDLSTKISMSDFDSGVYTIHIPALNYNYKLILIK